MRDHAGVKRAQLGEVPVEAAARDAELARQDIRLQSVEALARQRRQGEIDPVSSSQSLGHMDAPYSSVLTATIGALGFKNHALLYGGGECVIWRCRPRACWPFSS